MKFTIISTLLVVLYFAPDAGISTEQDSVLSTVDSVTTLCRDVSQDELTDMVSHDEQSVIPSSQKTESSCWAMLSGIGGIGTLVSILIMLFYNRKSNEKTTQHLITLNDLVVTLNELETASNQQTKLSELNRKQSALHNENLLSQLNKIADDISQHLVTTEISIRLGENKQQILFYMSLLDNQLKQHSNLLRTGEFLNDSTNREYMLSIANGLNSVSQLTGNSTLSDQYMAAYSKYNNLLRCLLVNDIPKGKPTETLEWIRVFLKSSEIYRELLKTEVGK